MLRMTFLIALTLFAGLYSTQSSAQIFDLEVTSYGGIPAPLRAFVDTEIQKIENDLNAELPSGAPDRLMEGMANSSVFAGKGIGTDYASNMSVFLIGAGVGVGADLEKPEGTDSPASGVGVAPGVIVGLNLGFLDSATLLGMDTDRLNMYVNFMSYSLEKKIDGKEEDQQSEVTLDMLNWGVHFRYDWVKPAGNRLLGWGGIKFTFGYEYNKTKIGFTSDIDEDVNETASTGETISGTITGSPKASILANTQSIPLAVSTDIQILYFVTLYTGLGADYNMGEAKGEGDLNGNDSSLTCTGGASCGAPQTITVKPRANLNTTAEVDAFSYRAFGGFQFNLPWTRIFVQVDKSLSNDLIGATAGLRFAF